MEDEQSIENAANQAHVLGPYQIIIVATGALHGDDFSPEKSFKQISAKNLQKVFNINAELSFLNNLYIKKLNNVNTTIHNNIEPS